MGSSPTNNPFSNTQLVDRLIGTAYDNVKLVSENLQLIKHVSINLPIISDVDDNITYIQLIHDNIEAVQGASANALAAAASAAQAAASASSLTYANQSEAIAGVINNKIMSPLMVKTAIENIAGITQGELVLRDKTFTGLAGANQAYTLDLNPGTVKNVMVWVGGVRQRPTLDYTLSGVTLTVLTNTDALDVDTLIIGGLFAINTLGGLISDDFLQLATYLDQNSIDTSGSVLTTPRKKWAQLGLSPKDFSLTAGSGGDDTAAIQALLNYVGNNGGKADLEGKWNATKLTISQGNEYFDIIGNSTITFTSTFAQTAAIEITRGNFSVHGSVLAFGQYKSNYAAGFWYHSDTQIQFGDISKLNAVGFLLGIRIGDATHGASITSETTLVLPRTYGCPVAAQIEGYNTFITIVAPPALSSDAFGGNTDWQALPRHSIVTKGVGGLVVVAGEAIQTGSGLATDFNIDMRPSLTAGVLYYGRVTLLGVCCETGGPLASIRNPDALTGSADIARPRLSVIGCLGYHSQDNAPFIESAADYLGDIVWSNNNFWKDGSARTFPNIKCNNSLTRVYVDDVGFGNNFQSVLNGVVGGIQYFSRRSIVRAVGLPATVTVTGSNDLIYNTADNTGDLAKFNQNYNTVTGEFTVPPGGFKDMIIKASIRITGVTGRIYVMEKSTTGGSSYLEVMAGPVTNGVGQVIHTVTEAPAGYKYKIGLVPDTGAGAIPNASGYLNRLDIEASR